ncbi:DUF4386 domain-containing protein [Primorskyibacter sp. 2E107]|uniref:DUF4386 domain-containing protein n=1 Tax=Primorskyibacter sp. 2E107 TaxID=3403458 RepID=UPI003AF79D12
MHTALAQPHRPAAALPRTAGALYVLIILCGLSAELLLRGPILDSADTLAAHLPAFRLSLLADLTMILADIALALIFFTLLKPISEPLARAAMVLRLMQAALIAMGLVLLTGAALALPTLPQSAMLLTQIHAAGYDIGLIFFGINSLIMARLLCDAGGVPRLICAGIGVSGLVYIAGGLARLAAPGLGEALQPAYAIPMLSESALALWLLITGRLTRP